VAFFEALGAEGHRALAGTIAAIRRRAPGVPVILDAKRGDIASSNRQYAIAAFDELGADAVTVQPYLGGEALQPFLERPDKLVYVLARTSNPGCGELQDLVVDGVPLYRRVARTVAQTWNANGNCGLVLGATSPRELEEIRGDISPALPVLVPGVGAQGGDLREVIATHRRAGSRALVISVSRSVLWASSGPAFGDAARAEVQRLNAELAAGLGG
jgi:orotidine-5'-phosphate decarboxylase